MFSQSHGGSTIRELSRGTSAVLLRQMISWSSFLLLDQLSRDIIKQHLGLSEGQNIPSYYLLPAASFIGIFNVSLVNPIDVC